jgi:hypothetical protein
VRNAVLLCLVLPLLASIVVCGPGDRTPAEVVADIIRIGDTYSESIEIPWGNDPCTIALEIPSPFGTGTITVPTLDGTVDVEEVGTADWPWYRVTDDSIKRLCQAGRVCKLYGHRWECTANADGSVPEPFVMYTKGVELLTIEPIGFDRTCALCGLRQTRALSDWKDEKE